MIKKRITNIIFSIIVVGFIATVSLAPTNKTGQLQGKFNMGTSSATLNATNTITGTPFKLHGSTGNISVFYQATQGTSTPHYLIHVFTSINGATFTTQPVATITASTDETSTDLTHRDVPIPYAPWGRIDIKGITDNATNTTFDMWLPYQ